MPWRSKSTALWCNRVIELALREFSRACYPLSGSGWEDGEEESVEEAGNQVSSRQQWQLSLSRITHLSSHTHTSLPPTRSVIIGACGMPSRWVVWWVEAPRSFLIGRINQSARLSLHRHSSNDQMHQNRPSTPSNTPPIPFEEQIGNIPSCRLQNKYAVFQFWCWWDEYDPWALARPLLEWPFNGESAGEQSYRF